MPNSSSPATTPSLLLPEERLLAATIPDRVDHATLAALVEHPLDWSIVFRLALQEKAASEVWRRVSPLTSRSTSDPDLLPLRRLAMIADFRRATYDDAIAEAIEHLEQAGLQPVVLKGVAVASRLCHRMSLRAMSDLDVLIDPDRARDAWQLLQQRGWVWEDQTYPRNLYAAFHHLPPLVHSQHQHLKLEVHRTLFPPGHPFGFTADDLRSRSEQIAMAPVGVRVPSAEDLLLHICIHYAWSHGFETKTWRTLRDVWVLTDASVIDWDRFVQLAATTKAATCAYWTLRLASRLIGTPIDDEVLRRLHPPHPAWHRMPLERHFVRCAFRAQTVCPSGRVRNMLWRAALQPQRSGHGATRPWHFRVDTRHLVTPPAPPAVKPDRARRASSILRHLRTLVTG